MYKTDDELVTLGEEVLARFHLHSLKIEARALRQHAYAVEVMAAELEAALRGGSV